MEITLQIPDAYQVNEEPVELARRIQLYAALLMFQAKEISAGAAVELAGVDRFTFAVESRRLGIPLVDYPAEELSEELAAWPVKT
jgi:predicted HTH domain antitoxin